MKNLLILSIGFLFIFSCKKDSPLVPIVEQSAPFNPVANCNVSVADYDGFKFRYTYDSLGRITKIRMGNATYLYEYNPKSVVVTCANPLSESVYFLNDAGDADSCVTQQGATNMFYYKYIYNQQRELIKELVTIVYDGGIAYTVTDYEWKNGDNVKRSSTTNGITDVSYFTFDLSKPNQFKSLEEKSSFSKGDAHLIIKSEFADGFSETITYAYDSLGKVIEAKGIASDGLESSSKYTWVCK